MSSTHLALRSFIALGSLAYLFGCSSGGVAVPEIPASVAKADFCNLHNQITCAASLGCCKDGNVVYASQDECLKAVSCPGGITEIFDSPLLASGVLVYDGSAAADYLRGAAAYAKACGATTSPATGYPFISGTRSSGADCSPTPDDFTPTLSCGAGLSCSLTPTATGTTTGVCAPAPAVASAGAGFGAACTTGEDCRSGLCTGGTCGVDTKASFCQAPKTPTAPNNSTICPYYVGLYANDTTSNPITVTAYVSGCHPKKCVLIYNSTNQEYKCTLEAISGSSITTSNVVDISLGDPGTDGVDIYGLFIKGAVSSIAGTFGYWDNKKDCNVSGLLNDSFWLDGDGNGKKRHVQWYFTSSGEDDIYCYSN